MSQEYMLVIKIPISGAENFDRVIELEKSLSDEIDNLGVVDGHDATVHQIKIYIFTRHPIQAFERLQPVVKRHNLMKNMKAAFRSIRGDEFSVLYPPGLLRFTE